MIFSEKLVVLRKRSGLSQEELAEKLGVTRQAVHKWETEKAMPNIEILKVLSKLFDVSLDNLLNDKEDISFKSKEHSSSGKRIELGKVYVSEERVESIDIEGDNTGKTELEIKQQKEKDKRVKWTSRLGIFLFIASLVVCAIFMSNGDLPASTQSFDWDADPTPQMYLVAIMLLSGVVLIGVSIWSRFFMHKHLKSSNEYFNQLVATDEQILSNMGYTFVRLQHDLRAWFFYDPDNNCFGLYFKGKEQFVCPIQNYINFSYTVYGDGIVKEEKLKTSFVVGDIIGMGVHSSPIYSSSAGSEISFTLTYFDENGDDREYSYTLTSFRNYLFNKYDKDLAKIMILQSIPKASVENYDKIRTKLELEKNKIV